MKNKLVESWSKTAKKGYNKFRKLKSSKSMKAYILKADRRNIKVGSSERFYTFVANSRLRRK